MKKLGQFVNIYLKALAQFDAELNSPNVKIQPGRPDIDCAVAILKLMDPNYFKGVRDIVVAPSAYYGHVATGPDKDPATINLNADRIVQEAGGAQSGPETAIAVAKVIAHERGHIGSYKDPQQGFTGGEGPATNEEQKVSQWIENNKARIMNLPCMKA